MKPEVLLLFCLVAILPALWTIAHGETDIKAHDVPTPDKQLRANEKVASKTDDEAILREEEQINPDGFSVKELKQLEEKSHKYTFQAEVNKLMNIIINSLYSNREVFLRELISNASDALDKIRFLGLTDRAQIETNSKLEIKIKVDKSSRSLHILDSGIGMTKQELERNLGTIAKSGTTEFLEEVGTTGDTSSLIGQFGVGFYSAFLVADTVTVISKHNNDTQGVWISDAGGQFTISEDPRGNTLGRGTEIILHLKEDASEYLEEERLRSLVSKYSEFINFPIYLWASHEEEKEVPMTPEEIEAEKKKEEEDSEEVNLDEEKTTEETSEEETRIKKVKETVWGWELMNETKPIWTRNTKDITDDEYNNFYKAISKDNESPLMYSHFNAEGEVDFKSLLYVPKIPPKNMFDPSFENTHKGIKLYVRRVFITDEFKDILPKYLNFIKGLVDSDDLPLNVSREMLQEHKTLKVIKKKLVRKAIAMFQELAEDNTKYLEFYKNYGVNLKLGIIEDSTNASRLSKLLRYQSSKTGELSSFEDYISRMKEGQEQIYYLAGENKDSIQNSPLIERLIKKGYEVLYMTDAIDEYTITKMGDKFDGKYKLTNVAREQLKLDGEKEDQEQQKELEKEYEGVFKFLKKIMGKKIERAVLSNRLSGSPSALVSGSVGWTPNMERIVKAQTLGDPTKASNVFQPRKILELNPRHPIIKELKRLVDNDSEDKTAIDISYLLLDTAALTSGWSIDNPTEFSQRIVRVMNLGLNLDIDASVEEEEEEPVLEKVKEKEEEKEEYFDEEENKEEL